MTARDLISASLRLIGVTASGESASSADASDALASLNSLLESWSNESLLIPTRVREVFPLSPGVQTYTMGPGGDFATARPQRIESALIQMSSGTSVIELPMRILNQTQFADIVLKAMSSSLPGSLYSDQAYPLTSISVWPVPAESNNIVFYSWKPLSQIANLSTVLSLPPGYERALRYGLAVELAPEYGRQLPEVVAINAAESKAVIKRMNTRPAYLRADHALLGRARGGGGFDILSGGSGSSGGGTSDGTVDGGTF